MPKIVGRLKGYKVLRKSSQNAYKSSKETPGKTCETTNEGGDTKLKEASPCQPPARLCSAGDNVLHFPTMHSNIVGGEMKLILQYVRELDSFPGLS